MRASRSSRVRLSILLIIFFSAGCPDPCVFAGEGCNKTSDCPGSQVCRIARDFEVVNGCFIVEGKCIDVEEDDIACGSVDDCLDDECCDPATNTCVASWGYHGAGCDDLTCGDCDDTPFGERCVEDEDCDDAQVCVGVVSFQASTGVCRPSCSRDDECAFSQRCTNSACTVDIGTTCRIENNATSQDECLGLRCVNVDADDRRTDAYCTGFCSSTGEPGCPAGFVCDTFDVECRRL